MSVPKFTFPDEKLDPSAITSPATKEDYAWIKQGSSFSETQTFYMCLPDNCLLMFQLAYVEVGISPTAQVGFRFYDPKEGGVRIFKTINLSSRKFTVSKDEPWVVSCEHAKIKYIPGEDESFHITFQPSNKQPFTLDVVLSVVGGGVRVGDGKTMLNDNGNHYCKRVFIPRLTAEGQLHLSETPGKGNVIPIQGAVATMFREYYGNKPYNLISQGRLFIYHSDTTSVCTIQHHCTQDRGVMREGAVYYNGKAHACAAEFCPKDVPGTTDEANGYSIPSLVPFTIPLPDGTQFQAQWEVQKDSLIDRVDVLEFLPYLVRKVIQVLVSKPYLYHFYRTSLDLEVKHKDGSEETDNGRSFLEQLYLNP